jgi:hypothetical protein
MSIRVTWAESSTKPVNLNLHLANPEDTDPWSQTGGPDRWYEAELPTRGIPLSSLMQVQVFREDQSLFGCFTLRL